jgi:hypothetical protein
MKKDKIDLKRGDILIVPHLEGGPPLKGYQFYLILTPGIAIETENQKLKFEEHFPGELANQFLIVLLSPGRHTMKPMQNSRRVIEDLIRENAIEWVQQNDE